VHDVRAVQLLAAWLKQSHAESFGGLPGHIEEVMRHVPT
jgi:hypothetical protein